MQINKPVICQGCCYHEPMEYIKKDNFWKCPNCGGEFWPSNISLIENTKQIREAFENNAHISLSLQEGCRIPPKGNKKSGKNHSKDAQKKKHTPQKLFEKLFKQT